MTVKLHAPLRDYQERALEHLLAEKGNALFLELGLGKTLTTLEFIHQLKQEGSITRALIVAPRRICELVWRQEVESWGYPLSVHFLKGTPKQRQAALERPAHDVYLMTYENLQWIEGKPFPFDLVVFDELTKMKNSGSKRWRTWRRLMRDNDPWVLGLAGRPAPNGYVDLWAQMFALDGGRTLGTRKGAYLSEYFTDISRDPTRYHNYVLNHGAEEKIAQRLLDGGVLCMTAAEVLGQEPPVFLPNPRVELPSSAKDIYRELEDELMATMPDGTTVLPDHEAVVSMKLRQVSSGFILDEDRRAHYLHTAKLDLLQECVEEMSGEPLMVVYTYTEELKMIRERLGDVPYLGGGAREDYAQMVVDSWNRRKLPVLLVQPQAAGHGLNLQFGGHNILFYSCDWNLDTYEQVIGRLHRSGQESTVFIRHLVAGGIEDRILEALQAKSRAQDQLMAALET